MKKIFFWSISILLLVYVISSNFTKKEAEEKMKGSGMEGYYGATVTIDFKDGPVTLRNYVSIKDVKKGDIYIYRFSRLSELIFFTNDPNDIIPDGVILVNPNGDEIRPNSDGYWASESFDQSNGYKIARFKITTAKSLQVGIK